MNDDNVQIALFWFDYEEPFETKGASVYAPEDTLGLLGDIMLHLSQHHDIHIEWQGIEVNDYSAE